jgi:hypothetical protein
MKSARTAKVPMHTLPNVVALGMYLFSNKQEQKRAQEKKYHTHLPSAPRRLRHPVAVAANLPKPHLTKETVAGAGAGSPTTRWAEREVAAPYPWGYRMHETTIGEATSVS